MRIRYDRVLDAKDLKFGYKGLKQKCNSICILDDTDAVSRSRCRYSFKLELLADLDIGVLTSPLPALGGLWLV